MENYKFFILLFLRHCERGETKNKAAGSAALKGFSKYVEGLVSKTGSEFSPQSYSFAFSN